MYTLNGFGNKWRHDGLDETTEEVNGLRFIFFLLKITPSTPEYINFRINWLVYCPISYIYKRSCYTAIAWFFFLKQSFDLVSWSSPTEHGTAASILPLALTSYYFSFNLYFARNLFLGPVVLLLVTVTSKFCQIKFQRKRLEWEAEERSGNLRERRPCSKNNGPFIFL